MPNHVYSEITLYGVSYERAAPFVLNAEGEVDFEVLLPLPINHWPGSVGRQHKDAFPGTHLDDATSIWGTKWNAYGGPQFEAKDGCAVITFKTAWSHPRGWTCALFNTLKCNITARWLDEGRTDAFEEVWLQDDPRAMGPSWRQEVIADGTAEHRELHKALWGVERFEDEEDTHD